MRPVPASPSLTKAEPTTENELVERGSNETLRAPVRLKAVGAFLAVVGGLFLVGVISELSTGSDTAGWAIGFAAAAACLTSGLGLLASRRWGWAGAFGLAACATVIGLAEVARPSDVLGHAVEAALRGMVLPGLAIVLVLVSPASVRWLRQERDR